MKLVFISGQDNQEFWDLLDELRNEAKVIKSEWKGDFYVTEYDLNGTKYIYEEDMDLGIPYSIIKVDKYKRSQINKWKQEYADTVNGIILSEYDVKKNDGWFEDCEIEEDVEAV